VTPGVRRVRGSPGVVYHDVDVAVLMYMPHLGHVHAANSIRTGPRTTDREPPPQRGLQLGAIWYRLVAAFERPRRRRRATDPRPTPVTTASSRRPVSRRPVMQIRTDVWTSHSS